MRIHLYLLLLILSTPVHAIAVDGFDFGEEASTSGGVLPVIDLQVRYDAVRDLPRPVEPDFDRQLLRLRGGLDWMPDNAWRIRLTGRAHQSDQGNDKVSFNLDNSLLREEAIDEAYFGRDGETFGFRIGQSVLLPELSPMVWDDDLRVRGLAIQVADDLLDPAHRLVVANGRIDHALGSEAVLQVTQWQSRFETSHGALSAHFGWSAFGNVEAIHDGRRSNSGPDSLYVGNFRVANFDLAWSGSTAGFPWRIGTSLARNTNVEAASDAGRIDIVAGDAVGTGGFEIGIAAQRVQRDAVSAALNDDDWWFPTWMRGQRLWMAWGWRSGWSVRVAGFRERLDPMDDFMHRVLVDVEYRF